MMLRVPINEIEEESYADKPRKASGLKRLKNKFDIFKIKNPSVRKEKRMIRSFYRSENLESYMSQDKETFFSDIDRTRLLYRVLKSTKFSTEPEDFGIPRLLHERVYTDSYPLHSGPIELIKLEDVDLPEEKNTRQQLVDDWANLHRIFKYQPLNAIKLYFGTRIALYFAWLGTYTLMLIFPAFVGLWCFLCGLFSMEDFIPSKDICNGKESYYMCPLCDKNCSFWSLDVSCKYARYSHVFDNEGTLFFAGFVSIWAIGKSF